MKNTITFLLLIALTAPSCGLVKDLFGKKTPHEQYASKLEDKGLEDTPEGRQWLAASQKALENPYLVQLPYRQQGYFHADKSRALGLQFKAQQGERLTFYISKKTTTPYVIYADLYQQEAGRTTHLLSAPKDSTRFSFDVATTGSYLLRLQPELFHTGEYNLSVTVGPSLLFPVAGTKARAGSFWGASRDGGQRRHEGIDIFAPKLTPAVAAADGYVTGLREGGLGGKVVWIRPDGADFYLYYAHLDKQLVQEGQTVKKGQTIGLVGNTGNARHTPSHLHFGVYTASGPVDPLPFVNPTVKTAPALAAKNLTGALKLLKPQKDGTGALVKSQTVLVPLGATAKGYLAELPDGNLIQVPFTAAQVIKQPVLPATPVATLHNKSTR